MSQPRFIMLEALRDKGKHIMGTWISDYAEDELEPFFVSLSEIEFVRFRTAKTSWLFLKVLDGRGIAISGSVEEIAEAINQAK